MCGLVTALFRLWMERCVADVVIILFSRHSPGFNGFQSIMIDEDVERSTKRKEDEKTQLKENLDPLFAVLVFRVFRVAQLFPRYMEEDWAHSRPN